MSWLYLEKLPVFMNVSMDRHSNEKLAATVSDKYFAQELKECGFKLAEIKLYFLPSFYL